MPDLSAIPLGTGVEIFTGLNKALDYLFDPNRATYKINSSSTEWCLIYIRATKDESLTDWQFTLESDTVANVAKVYDKTDPAYDPPRVVDSLQDPIPVNNNETVPAFEAYVNPDATQKTYVLTEILPTGWTLNLVITTQLKYRKHIIQEVGTYIMPIAYHIATDAGLDIRQVARSDWAFWPMPHHAAWHRAEEIISFTGGSSLPPPGY